MIQKSKMQLYIVRTRSIGIRVFCEDQLHKARQLSAMTGNKIKHFESSKQLQKNNTFNKISEDF